jgi:hypothetical protein
MKLCDETYDDRVDLTFGACRASVFLIQCKLISEFMPGSLFGRALEVVIGDLNYVEELELKGEPCTGYFE